MGDGGDAGDVAAVCTVFDAFAGAACAEDANHAVTVRPASVSALAQRPAITIDCTR